MSVLVNHQNLVSDSLEQVIVIELSAISRSTSGNKEYSSVHFGHDTTRCLLSYFKVTPVGITMGCFQILDISKDI
jgi:hypothetical protein